MKLVITDVGKQALVNAQQTGTAQLTLAEIAVGSGQYTPDASQTELHGEIKRLPIIQASANADHEIHVAFQDDSTDSYNVYEFGVYTDDGILFAVYSSNELILSKAANSSCLLTVDMIIDDLDVSDITFGSIEFATGAATTENAGIMEIATQAEAEAGDDAYKVITPVTMTTVFASRFESTFASQFPTAFENSFNTAFTEAFTSYFPAAFEQQFENDFGLAFDNAFSAAFDDAFNTAFENSFGDAFDNKFAASFTTAFNTAFNNTFPASFSDSFQARLASKSATLTGTSGSYAVTPAGLNYAITNMTWNIGKATATATGTTAARSLADRFADIANPLNYGAKGDGTTNDTNAFTALENAVTGQMVDLLGKSYRVSTSPTGNSYYNGHFVVAGTSLDPVGVNIADGQIINAQGKTNPVLYPSGKSKIYQANNGTNQAALARFSNDTAGNSLVFLKSRAGNVNNSKTAIAGDIVAQLNFLADNGNLNYSSTTAQGASVAQIECAVSESSTLTSAGTTATAVRGVLRLLCNEDGGSREGTGIEIMNNTLRPTVDNVLNLGTSGRRWKAVYAATDVISTSDERDKRNIQPIPDAVLDAWEKVNFCQYQFRLSEEIYFGVIAQEIVKAFESKGLNALDYGIVILEGERYSVRYRECNILEAACVRRRLDRIEKLLEG